MKILVTVGSTSYDSLIKAVDTEFPPSDFDVTIQKAEGAYVPKNHLVFNYIDDISNKYKDYDVVITHAGAGSVFELLELQVNCVVVPNIERSDSHQQDIAKFIENNRYAVVCSDLTTIYDCVLKARKQTQTSYQYERFSGFDLIEQELGLRDTEFGVINGLKISLFKSLEEATRFILPDSGQVHCGSAIAINPEKIISSMKSGDVQDVLLGATIRYADGIGVVKTLERKTNQKISRIPGCELWECLMEKAGKLGTPVYLIGSKSAVISETKKKLVEQYGTNIVGCQDGFFDNEESLINSIIDAKPSIVTIAMGSPKQEKLIAKCRESWPDAFYMGVGGTYDVYTNNVKRAPEFFRKLHLEWFYRLASNPSRIFRQRNLVTYLWYELRKKL